MQRQACRGQVLCHQIRIRASEHNHSGSGDRIQLLHRRCYRAQSNGPPSVNSKAPRSLTVLPLAVTMLTDEAPGPTCSKPPALTEVPAAVPPCRYKRPPEFTDVAIAWPSQHNLFPAAQNRSARCAPPSPMATRVYVCTARGAARCNILGTPALTTVAIANPPADMVCCPPSSTVALAVS